MAQKKDNGKEKPMDFEHMDDPVRYEILADEKVSIDDKIACLLTMQPDMTMQKEELKAMLSDKTSSKDFLDFIKGIKDVHDDFGYMMEHFRDRLNSFQAFHPQQLTCMALFHIEGNPYTQEPGMGGVNHCLTNILNTDNGEQTEQEKTHIIEILFNNAKMSRAFCDIIVGAYLCIKRVGLDKGSSYLNDVAKDAKR